MPDHSSSTVNAPGPSSLRHSAVIRSIAFFVLWMALMQSVKLPDLAIGAFAALCATGVSLRLLPPEAGRLRFGSVLLLVPHFLWQSVRAGIDVAGRALGPRVRLHTGFVSFPSGLPAGLARNTFTTVTSLLPGTVPCGEEDGVIVYHCLDTLQPVVDQLTEEEQRLSRVVVSGRSHG
ncbi:MAG: Na+/H+ antiporter subunit E [Burkholderiaceae bacterium]|nr:Na+/H+ antiporter subunit E [Burkholderiaceae bacterium]